MSADISENLKYKGDIPLVVYINFETTTPTHNCLDPEVEKYLPFLTS